MSTLIQQALHCFSHLHSPTLAFWRQGLLWPGTPDPPAKCWDYRCIPTCLSQSLCFLLPSRGHRILVISPVLYVHVPLYMLVTGDY